VDVKHVGKELAVRYTLEGSEQHGGDKVRVNAQLMDAETGTHLWADQFDEARSDLLQMQDDIVTRVAKSSHFELVAVDATRLTRSRPGTLGADDLSLRCRAANFYSQARPDGLRGASHCCNIRSSVHWSIGGTDAQCNSHRCVPASPLLRVACSLLRTLVAGPGKVSAVA
jgi:hypothetical protein